MNTHNTIGKGSSHRSVNGGNDAYFTKPEIAANVAAIVNARYPGAAFVEPSAGNGAFMGLFPGIIGYDLDPKAVGIIKADWFTVDVAEGSVIVGNPPFGFAANLAVRFFNHAASKAKAICFIVPRSFRKASVQRRLDPLFHLVHEEVLPVNAFSLDGVDYAVPCVFQIWEKQEQARETGNRSSENPYIAFCKKSEAKYAIRRVGGRAGEILDGVDHNENTTLFFKAKTRAAVGILRKLSPVIHQMRDNTAGVRSISKNELAALLNAYAMGNTK